MVFWSSYISNDNNALKLTDDDNVNDWHSLQLLGVKPEGYMTCDSALKVSGVHSNNQVSDQQLTSPQEPEREEQVLAEGNIFGCTVRAISGQENQVLLILKGLILPLHSFTVATVNGGYMFQLHKVATIRLYTSEVYQAVYIRSIKGNYIPVVYSYRKASEQNISLADKGT
jgi:hypothetical protein